MSDDTLIPLLPKRLPDGRKVDVCQNSPEMGGVAIIIWDDDTEDSGDFYTVKSPMAAHAFLRRLIDLQKGGAHG